MVNMPLSQYFETCSRLLKSFIFHFIQNKKKHPNISGIQVVYIHYMAKSIGSPPSYEMF